MIFLTWVFLSSQLNLCFSKQELIELHSIALRVSASIQGIAVLKGSFVGAMCSFLWATSSLLCVRGCVPAGGHACIMSFFMCAPTLHYPVTEPLDIGRKDPSKPWWRRQLTLQALERKLHWRPFLSVDIFEFSRNRLIEASKPSLPHLFFFLTTIAREAYCDIIHKKRVCLFVWHYSYSRKVRKPRKCFPTLVGCLPLFLLFNFFW